MVLEHTATISNYHGHNTNSAGLLATFVLYKLSTWVRK